MNTYRIYTEHNHIAEFDELNFSEYGLFDPTKKQNRYHILNKTGHIIGTRWK